MKVMWNYSILLQPVSRNITR